MKPGASAGRMPANVLLSARPTVIAGFAKDVDAVNQYAAPIHAGTRHPAIDREHETARGHDLGQPLRRARAHVRGSLNERQFEHAMSQHGAQHATHDLRNRVATGITN